MLPSVASVSTSMPLPPILTEHSYFEETLQISELKRLLDGAPPTTLRGVAERTRGLKSLLAMVSKGTDVSRFFPDVVRNVLTTNFELKRLVYMFLAHYVDHDDETRSAALLAINSFQKDLQDSNEVVRALALRTLTSFRVEDVQQIQVLAVQQCLRDPSEYVRKVAAIAVTKLPRSKTLEEDVLAPLLRDASPGVVGSAASAFLEVCPDRVDLLHPAFRRLCTSLQQIDEWGQIAVLTLLTRYARKCFARPPPDGAGEDAAGAPSAGQDSAPAWAASPSSSSAAAASASGGSWTMASRFRGNVVSAAAVDHGDASPRAGFGSAASRGRAGLADPAASAHHLQPATPVAVGPVRPLPTDSELDSFFEDAKARDEVGVNMSNRGRDGVLSLPLPRSASAGGRAKGVPATSASALGSPPDSPAAGAVASPSAGSGGSGGGGGGGGDSPAAAVAPEAASQRSGNGARPTARTSGGALDFMDDDHKLLLRATLPLLKSRNAGVVAAAASMMWACGRRSPGAMQRVAEALVRLVHAPHAEARYLALNIVLPLVRARPAPFVPFVQDFFINGATDPPSVRALKLEALTLLVGPPSVSAVLRELESYALHPSAGFASAAVRAVGRIAVRLGTDVARDCLLGLQTLMTSGRDAVACEAVVVARDVLRRQPDEDALRIVLSTLPSMSSSRARTAALWLACESCRDAPLDACDALRVTALRFASETSEVKVEALELAARLAFLARASSAAELMGERAGAGSGVKGAAFSGGEVAGRVLKLTAYVFELASFDPDWDVRDKGRLFAWVASGGSVSDDVLFSSGKRPATPMGSPAAPLLNRDAVADASPFAMDSLSHLLGRAVPGALPLPDWADVGTDPKLRASAPLEGVRFASPGGARGGEAGPRRDPRIVGFGPGSADYYASSMRAGAGAAVSPASQARPVPSRKDMDQFLESESDDGSDSDEDEDEDGEEEDGSGEDGESSEEGRGGVRGQAGPPLAHAKAQAQAPTHRVAVGSLLDVDMEVAPAEATAAPGREPRGVHEAAAALSDVFAEAGGEPGAAAPMAASPRVSRAPATEWLGAPSLPGVVVLPHSRGRGLQAEAVFPREQPEAGWPRHTRVTLRLTNRRDDGALTDVKMVDFAKDGSVVPFEDVPSIAPNATVSASLLVDFGGRWGAPGVTFSLSTDEFGRVPVEVRAPVGELMVPAAGSGAAGEAEAEFRKRRGELGGMQEARAKWARQRVGGDAEETERGASELVRAVQRVANVGPPIVLRRGGVGAGGGGAEGVELGFLARRVDAGRSLVLLTVRAGAGAGGGAGAGDVQVNSEDPLASIALADAVAEALRGGGG